MPNLEKIIKSHNSKIEKNEQCNSVEEKSCNCKGGNICPFGGQCMKKEIIYDYLKNCFTDCNKYNVNVMKY